VVRSRLWQGTHAHANVIVEPQIDFTASQVRALKEFYEDFFDAPPRCNEAKAIGQETGTALQDMIRQIDPLAANSARYPFLSALNPVLKKLKEISGRPYTWYLIELVRMEDDLLDMKENILDPIRKFMNGPQKEIYDATIKFMQTHESNFDYIKGDEINRIRETMINPDCFKGNRIQQMKILVDSLKEKVDDQTAQVVSTAKETVATLKKQLQAMGEFATLSEDRQKQLIEPFDVFVQSIERQSLIAVIRDTARRFEKDDYNGVLSQMSLWAAISPVTPKPYIDPTMDPIKETEKKGTNEKCVGYVTSGSLKVSFNKPWLEDEADVAKYLDAMGEVLRKEIADGKRIRV